MVVGRRESARAAAPGVGSRAGVDVVKSGGTVDGADAGAEKVRENHEIVVWGVEGCGGVWAAGGAEGGGGGFAGLDFPCSSSVNMPRNFWSSASLSMSDWGLDGFGADAAA